MIEYEELLKRCRKAALDAPRNRDGIDHSTPAVLAEVLRTLRVEAGGNGTFGAIEFRRDLEDWLCKSSLVRPDDYELKRLP
jgi:hypothetical protein